MTEIEIKYSLKHITKIFVILLSIFLSLQILTPCKAYANEVNDTLSESRSNNYTTEIPGKIWFDKSEYKVEKFDYHLNMRTEVKNDLKDSPILENLEFETSNPENLYVNRSYGQLVAKKDGTYFLYARSENGLVARTKIIVSGVSQSYIDNDYEIFEGNEELRVIGKGRSINLKAQISVTGSDAFNYKTSNSTVATVDKNGVLKGNAVGKTNLIVTRVESGVTKTVPIEVRPAKVAKNIEFYNVVTSLSLNTPEAMKFFGDGNENYPLKDSKQLLTKIEPAEADQLITYQSSNPSVASVDKYGKVTAHKAGTAVVTAKTDNGLTTSIDVNVNDYYQGDFVRIKAGSTLSSLELYKNGNLMKRNEYTMTLDEEAKQYAYIDNNGNVKCYDKTGHFFVSVLVDGIYVRNVYVELHDGNVTPSISFKEDVVVKMGASYYIEPFYSYMPKPEFKYNVSNNAVLSVDEKGIVTPKYPGTTYVTITTSDGKYSGKTKVKVIGSAPNKTEFLQFDTSSITLKTNEKKKVLPAIYPASSIETVTYTSNNAKVATVEKDGTVTARGTGVTYINAKSTTGLTTRYLVYVNSEDEAKKITLNTNSATLSIGKGFQVKATVTPTTATNKKVTWRSSSPTIASVDANGNVKALKAGYTYIIAKTANGIEEKCLVKVVDVTPKLNVTNATLSIGKGFQAKVTNISNGITWRSSSPAIASVDAKGNVKALKSGSTYIIAKTANGNEVKCLVKVVSVDPTSVSMNISNATLTIGKTFTARATVYPTNATNKGVTFTSSNPKVATVDQSGKVTTVGAGIAEIKATTKNGKVGVIKVKVLPDPESVAITPSSATVKVGASFKARAIVTPSNASATGTFKSSSPSIASVDANGNVKAIKEGYTYISVTTANGKTAKFLLHVVN